MPKSILDRSFVYVPARMTDLRKTFARVRKEQRASDEETKRVVMPMQRKAGR